MPDSETPQVPEFEARETPYDGIHSDIWWVYEALGQTQITQADAPSSGAWGLLAYALKNRREFYLLFTKICPSADDLKREEKYKDRGGEVLERLDRYLEGLEDDDSEEP